MGAYKDCSIKEIMEQIYTKQILLPAIQRKYVWNEGRITALFDSIMRGYPIGTMLFWKITRQNQPECTFYNFICNYSEKDNYNNESVISPLKITGLPFFFLALDGQQRLTSLYIALCGSLEVKKPYAHKGTKNAFVKKELYLNLARRFKPDEETDDMQYEFRFLTETDAANRDEEHSWYKVKNILGDSVPDDQDRAEEEFEAAHPGENLQRSIFRTLYRVIRKERCVNYFEIEGKGMDEVLDIFVRVNSGGVVLSKSDLLFSTIISSWDGGREKVEELIKNINEKGSGFKITNDFVMRGCLYILDLPFKLKVTSFSKDNIAMVRDRWNDMADAFDKTFSILEEYGFCDATITSYNAIMPAVYYVFRGGKIDKAVKEEIKKYFIVAQLKQLFGGAGETTLVRTREAVSKALAEGKTFRMDIFDNIKSGTNKEFRLVEDDINGWLDEITYGTRQAFFLLSLLYDDLNFGETKEWHIDHLHPQKGFAEINLKAKGFSVEQIKTMREKQNKAANLQLLAGAKNISKNDAPLSEWIEDKHTIRFDPVKEIGGCTYSFDDFDKFFAGREQLMRQKLKEILF